MYKDKIQPSFLNIYVHVGIVFNRCLSHFNKLLKNWLFFGIWSTTITLVVYVFRNDFATLKNSLKSFALFVPELNKISALFNHPHENSPCCLNETLLYLSGEITRHIETFSSWSDELPADIVTPSDAVGDQVTEFSNSTDDVVAAMLLGVQNLVMHHGKELSSATEVEKADDGKMIT